jgi:hypothetical protein
MIRPIEICGSDTTMDHRNLMAGGPGINPLPAACKTCGFPDLDFVPTPYFLIRSRATSNNEFALAEFGNVLVKARVRKIFETAIPGLCDFHPTFFLKSTELTPWFLAVPRKFGSTGAVSNEIDRCPDCGQPVSAHPGSQYESREIQSQYDLAKSINWASSEYGWSQWMHRDSIMSVRLYRLLKALKVRSLYESTSGNRPETAATKEESSWVQRQVNALQDDGSTLTGQLSPEETKWFNTFLRKFRATKASSDTRSNPPSCNVPPSFAQFLDKFGPQQFSNVDGTEDEVSLLPLAKWKPHKLTDETHRDESDPKQPILFASTQFGDDFCFDAGEPGPEYSVYRYIHEMDCYESYARNFVQALQRFTT